MQGDSGLPDNAITLGQLIIFNFVSINKFCVNMLQFFG